MWASPLCNNGRMDFLYENELIFPWGLLAAVAISYSILVLFLVSHVGRNQLAREYGRDGRAFKTFVIATRPRSKDLDRLKNHYLVGIEARGFDDALKEARDGINYKNFYKDGDSESVERYRRGREAGARKLDSVNSELRSFNGE